MTKYYIFVAVLCSLVLTLVIITVLVSGTPSEHKAITLDKQRLQAFDTIAIRIKSYSDDNKLPQSLSQVSSLNSSYSSKILTDPETGKSYDYKLISDTSFQLCAVFSTESYKQDKNTLELFAEHNISYKKGYNCFTYHQKSPKSKQINQTITTTPKPTKKPTPEPIPTVAIYPTIAPTSIGLTLEKTTDGKSVNMKITDTSKLARIDWALYYHSKDESGNIILNDSRGIFYNTHETNQFSQRFTLGECRAGTCTYDKDVNNIYLSLKGITTDGRSYQVQKTLDN